MSQERRHFTRILFRTHATLTTTSGDSYGGEIQDISLKGALLAMAPGWTAAPDEVCRLDIPLDHADAMITMAGRVAHVEGNQAGVRCESIDLDSISHLRRLVELNLGDESLLNRELSALVHGD